MANKEKDKKKAQEVKKQGLEPDPETLHTTDPQEHMKGPISSSMQNIKHEGEKNDTTSKEEATKKHDERM
jgi:hypothetical protein